MTLPSGLREGYVEEVLEGRGGTVGVKGIVGEGVVIFEFSRVGEVQYLLAGRGIVEKGGEEVVLLVVVERRHVTFLAFHSIDKNYYDFKNKKVIYTYNPHPSQAFL